MAQRKLMKEWNDKDSPVDSTDSPEKFTGTTDKEGAKDEKREM